MENLWRYLLKWIFRPIKTFLSLIWKIYNCSRGLVYWSPKSLTKGVLNETVLHYGLENQGATCYLNAALQVLFMTGDIYEILKKKSSLNPTDEVLKNLFDNLMMRHCGTKTITEHLKIMNVYEQRDAAEYLEHLLRKMSPEVSKPFYGKLTDVTQCDKNVHTVEETTEFFTLPLPVVDCCSVMDGLDKMSEWKSLPENSYYCNECQRKTNARTICTLAEVPQILTLLLKRFEKNKYGYKKSESEIELSEKLEIKGQTYLLTGVVDHMGSVSGGHYTASFKDQTWWHFNDATVTQVEEQRKKSSTAYMLIYRRTDSSQSSTSL